LLLWHLCNNRQARRMFEVPTHRKAALALDAADPLAAARSQFEIAPQIIYLVGHSLGPLPGEARRRASQALAAWQSELVRAWNSAGWIDLAERIGDRIAGLIGAEPGSVMVTDNVSVNLFKLAAPALRLCRTGRLVIEEDEFPTDQYIISGLARFLDIDVVRAAPGEGMTWLREGGVLVKSAVSYRSGEIADIGRHEAEARRHGAQIVWDLSHATGVVNLDLHASGARLATGCTYKYLNGGPGAPAFVYVSPEIAGGVTSPLPGWMGHQAPFAFDSDYRPRAGAARFASGTPAILSLAALEGALDVFQGYEMPALQHKAAALGALAISRAAPLGLEVSSPRENHRRGGHVSFRIAHGFALVQALAARGVLADFRAPDTVRLGFSPLVLSYTEVWDAMETLSDILMTRSWNDPQFLTTARVT
jgi:kynureninase